MTDQASTRNGGMRGFIPASRQSWLTLAAFVLAYFLLARTGLWLSFPGSNASPLWPPSGLALALVLVRGPKQWPAIFVGAFAANLCHLIGGLGTPTAPAVWISLATAVGNTLEALAGYCLISCWCDRPTSAFDSAGKVFRFSLAVVIAAGVSAGIGPIVLCSAGTAGWPLLPNLLFTWWTGDLVGMILLTPVLVLWVEPQQESAEGKHRSGVFAAALLVTGGATLLFFGVFFSHPVIASLEYLLLPLLLLFTRFLERRFAVSVMLWVALGVVGCTVEGLGPFVRPSLNTSLVLVQGFVGALALTVLLLAAHSFERNQAARALRASESTLQTLFKSMTAGIFVLDLDCRFHACNQHWADLLGYRVEEVLQKKYTDILHADSLSDARERISKLRSHALTDYQEERKFIRKDGAAFWGLLSVSPLAGADDRFMLTVMDITTRKETEQELRKTEEALRAAHADLENRVQERTRELTEANERLKELDRLKSQFLSTMSHELRTPLNSIIGFTGILRKGFAGPVNEEQQKQLDIVYNSSKHLLYLINDLLDLSRIEAGKVTLEKVPFDFGSVIQEVIDSLQPSADQKSLRLGADLSEKPLIVTGDRKRCFQILLNLANNAVKFTDHGEVRITAKIGEQGLVVEVIDTGIGIRDEHIGTLFEAFRQLDGSARRVYEGTGLGLHLCRKLLDLMSGSIGVRSVFGEGSVFTFSIPQPPQSD